jgi:hypothetical protein
MQVLGSLQKLGTDSNLLRRVAAGQVRWLIEFWLMLTVKWGSSLKFITFLDSFRIDPAMDCGVYWGITASVTEFELELQWKHLTCQPFLLMDIQSLQQFHIQSKEIYSNSGLLYSKIKQPDR